MRPGGLQEVGENAVNLTDLCSKVLERSTRQTVHRWVAANNFDHPCNGRKQIADFVSTAGGKFPDCGQAFRTRHLLAMLTFHRLTAPVQLLNHMVEDTTEVPNFVIATPKVYPDIEVPFAETDNLALKFRHHGSRRPTEVGPIDCGTEQMRSDSRAKILHQS
jgi:hypothetical protein